MSWLASPGISSGAGAKESADNGTGFSRRLQSRATMMEASVTPGATRYPATRESIGDCHGGSPYRRAVFVATAFMWLVLAIRIRICSMSMTMAGRGQPPGEREQARNAHRAEAGARMARYVDQVHRTEAATTHLRPHHSEVLSHNTSLKPA